MSDGAILKPGEGTNFARFVGGFADGIHKLNLRG